MQTLQQLVTLQETTGAFGSERMQKLDQALAEDSRSDMPWYLRFIIAAGAWLASVFFIGFFMAMIGWHDNHRTGLGIAGLMLVVGSTILVRPKLGLFVNQCCLAASLAGQGMIYFGFLPEQHHTLGSAVALSIGLGAALYWFYPDMLLRLITCVAALQITLAWIYLGGNGGGFISGNHLDHDVLPLTLLYWVFHLVALGWCLMRTSRWSRDLAPLGYALVISLAAWQCENLSGFWVHNEFAGGWAPGQAVTQWPYYIQPISTALILFGVVVWAAGGTGTLSSFALSYAGLACALFAIIWLGAGGVMLPLLLITLGFFTESRVILGMGLILLPVFLFSYYYNLRLDLLAKSVALAGAGLALLLLRAGLRRWLQLEFKEVL
jgi:uncharacterized membrane protein